MVHVVDSVLAEDAVDLLMIDHGTLDERRSGIHVVPKATAQIIQRNHLVAHVNQLIDDMRSHESSGSRDERDSHSCVLLSPRVEVLATDVTLIGRPMRSAIICSGLGARR